MIERINVCIYVRIYIYTYILTLCTSDLDIYIKCTQNLHGKYIVNILTLLRNFCTVECMLAETRRFGSRLFCCLYMMFAVLMTYLASTV